MVRGPQLHTMWHFLCMWKDEHGVQSMTSGDYTVKGHQVLVSLLPPEQREQGRDWQGWRVAACCWHYNIDQKWSLSAWMDEARVSGTGRAVIVVAIQYECSNAHSMLVTLPPCLHLTSYNTQTACQKWQPLFLKYLKAIHRHSVPMPKIWLLLKWQHFN